MVPDWSHRFDLYERWTRKVAELYNYCYEVMTSRLASVTQCNLSFTISFITIKINTFMLIDHGYFVLPKFTNLQT